MAQQVKYPGTATDAGSDWTDVNNIKVDDGSIAYAFKDFSFVSTQLTASNFGFTIPTGATINWVKVDIRKCCDENTFQGNCTDQKIALYDGTSESSNYADTGTYWPGVGTWPGDIVSTGGSDNWGLSLNTTKVNSSAFAVRIQTDSYMDSGHYATPYIDSVAVTVDYSPPPQTYTQGVYFDKSMNFDTEGLIFDSGMTSDSELTRLGMFETLNSDNYIKQTYEAPGSQVWSSPVTAGTVSGWTNNDNAKTEDGNFATFTQNDWSGLTPYIIFDNWGFSIPAGATISAVKVRIKKKSSELGSTACADSEVVLYDGVSTFSNNYKAGGFWPTTNTWFDYGGTDNWGLSLTPSIVNSSGFGVWIKGDIFIMSFGMSNTASIDVVTMEIEYTGSGMISNSQIQDTSSDTLDSDANVKQSYIETINSDADVKDTYSKDILSDAYIKELGQEGTIDSNASIFDTYSNTTDSDGHILRLESDTIDSDGEIKQTYSDTLNSDVEIKTTYFSNIISNSSVTDTYEDTINSNSFIKDTGQTGIGSIAFITDTYENTIDSNASVSDTYENTIDSNSYIKGEAGKSIFSDALIVKTWTYGGTYNSGEGYNEGYVFDGGLYSDTFIKQTYTETLNSDASVKYLAYEETIDSDGNVKILDITEAILSDAMVKVLGYEGSILSSSFVKTTYETGTISDASVKVFDNTETIDSDGFIKKEYEPSAITSDAFITDTYENNLPSDAFIKTTYTETLLSDAEVKKEYTVPSIVSDSFIKETITVTAYYDDDDTVYGDTLYDLGLLADSFVKDTYDDTIDSNAFIKTTYAEVIYSDAFITDTYQNTIDSNSFIKVIGEEGSISSNAEIKQTYTKILLSDGNVKILDITNTIDSDAWLQRVEGGSLSSDAQVELLTYPEFVSPIDGVKVYNAVLTWKIPENYNGQNVGAVITITGTATYNTGVNVYESWKDSGFEYHNGTGWVPYPIDGVEPAYQGNNGRLTIAQDKGPYDWNVRGTLQ